MIFFKRRKIDETTNENDCWKQCWRKLNDNWKIDEINKNKTKNECCKRNWHDQTIEINRKIDVEID